jgi:hypothetical protein
MRVELFIAQLIGMNLNNAGSDNSLAMPWSNYRITKVSVSNPSTSLAASIATLGLYTGTGGSGTAIVTLGLLTTGLVNPTDVKDMTLANPNLRLTNATLQLRNGIAHGSAATVDVYIFADVYS